MKSCSPPSTILLTTTYFIVPDSGDHNSSLDKLLHEQWSWDVLWTAGQNGVLALHPWNWRKEAFFLYPALLFWADLPFPTLPAALGVRNTREHQKEFWRRGLLCITAISQVLVLNSEEPSEFNDNYSIAETMKSELSLEQPTSVWSTLASQYWRAETSMMHPHAVKWEINPAVWGGYQDEVALHPPSHTEFISSSSGEGRTRWSSLMGYQKEGTFAHKTALV